MPTNGGTLSNGDKRWIDEIRAGVKEGLAGVEMRLDKMDARQQVIGKDVAKIEAHQQAWQSTMCEPHSKAIGNLSGEVSELKSITRNRWPALIASAVGAALVVIPLAVVILKHLQGNK